MSQLIYIGSFLLLVWLRCSLSKHHKHSAAEKVNDIKQEKDLFSGEWKIVDHDELHKIFGEQADVNLGSAFVIWQINLGLGGAYFEEELMSRRGLYSRMGLIFHLDIIDELCQVLNCKRKEVCLVRRNNAFCVARDLVKLHLSGDGKIDKTTARGIDEGNLRSFEVRVTDDTASEDQDDDDVSSNEDSQSIDENVVDFVVYSKPVLEQKPTPEPYSADRIKKKLAKYYSKLYKSKLPNEYEKPKLERSSIETDEGVLEWNSAKKYLHKKTSPPELGDPNVPPHVDRHEEDEPEDGKATSDQDKDCTPTELTAMGQRMLKWFADIHTLESKSSNYHLPEHKVTCNTEVAWMFGQLDGDRNKLLSPQELWTLEHDQYEPCLRPYVDHCDQNADMNIGVDEWCDCFSYTKRENEEPPCHAARHRADPHLLGAFLPTCDVDGFYKTGQCHEGQCWCVDKWGREFPNSRIHGSKPDCGQYNKQLPNVRYSGTYSHARPLSDSSVYFLIDRRLRIYYEVCTRTALTGQQITIEVPSTFVA